MDEPKPGAPSVAVAASRKYRPAIVVDMLAAQQRERVRISSHLGTIRGLMPLLMKRRNGMRWTAQERSDLYAQLRSLSNLSPYLLVLALPGSFLMLPALAWWLDRRRGQR